MNKYMHLGLAFWCVSVYVCVPVMWEVVCHAFAALCALKQGQATPGATWQYPAPQTPTSNTADGHAAKWRESVWGPHGQTHAVNKKKHRKNESSRQGKLFKWTHPECTKNCLSVFPCLFHCSHISSASMRMCSEPRSRLQSVCQNILETGQSEWGWLHLAIARHNTPPAVQHTRPKTQCVCW